MATTGTDTPERGHVLAGEYVLGVLEGEARLEAERRLATDADFAAQVAFWEDRFAPLTDGIDPVEPPASLKPVLMTRAFGAADKAGTEGLLGRLIFWQAATAIAAGIALLAVALTLVPQRTPAPDPVTGTPARLVAALQPGDAAPALLVQFEPDSGVLRLQGLETLETGAGQVPELWVIPEGQSPISLGVLTASGGAQAVDIPAVRRADLVPGSALAISLEPDGGSPTGAPTGPVVALGAVQQL